MKVLKESHVINKKIFYSTFITVVDEWIIFYLGILSDVISCSRILYKRFKRIAAHQLEKGKKPRRSSVQSPDIKPGEWISNVTPTSRQGN